MGTHLENMLLTVYLYFAPYCLTMNIYEQTEISFGLNHIFRQSSRLEGKFNVCELFVFTLSMHHEMKIILSTFCEHFDNNGLKVVNLVPL